METGTKQLRAREDGHFIQTAWRRQFFLKACLRILKGAAAREGFRGPRFTLKTKITKRTHFWFHCPASQPTTCNRIALLGCKKRTHFCAHSRFRQSPFRVSGADWRVQPNQPSKPERCSWIWGAHAFRVLAGASRHRLVTTIWAHRLVWKKGQTKFAARRRKPHARGVCSPLFNCIVTVKIHILFEAQKSKGRNVLIRRSADFRPHQRDTVERAEFAELVQVHWFIALKRPEGRAPKLGHYRKGFWLAKFPQQNKDFVNAPPHLVS